MAARTWNPMRQALCLPFVCAYSLSSIRSTFWSFASTIRQSLHSRHSAMMRLVVIVFVPLVVDTVTSSAIEEQKKRLAQHLFRNDMLDVVPRVKRSSVITVGVDLAHVVHQGFDESSRELHVKFGIRLRWNDLRLRWKPRDFGGVTTLADHEFDTNRIWQPIVVFDRDGQYFKCHPLEVHSSGNVTCMKSARLSLFCYMKNLEDFPVNSFVCRAVLYTEAVVGTCDVKGKYCLETSKSDHQWRYDLSVRHLYTHLAKEEWGHFHRSAFLIQFELTRIHPRTKIVYSPIIVLGCVVLVQCLLQVGFQEKIFLNAAFTVASIMVIVSLHTYPTVLDGGGGKVLRLSATVALLNCAVMVVSVLSANFLHSINARFDLNAKVHSIFHRMKMSIFLPTIGGPSGGDADQCISLSITINRLLFVLFCLVFIIIALVP